MILYLNVTVFFSSDRCDLIDLCFVSYRTQERTELINDPNDQVVTREKVVPPIESKMSQVVTNLS